MLVLGAAAGGGFPQWNSNNEASQRARRGDPAARPSSQSSIAVSADGENWVLFNASPDIRQQINDNPQMHPQRGVRHSPIAAVVLTNGDVDHVAGLLTLRERYPLAVYATGRVLEVLSANSIFNVLNPEFVDRRSIALNQGFEPRKKDGSGTGLRIVPFAVPGKVALYLEDESAGSNFGTVEEDTIALRVEDRKSGTYFLYVPACAKLSDTLTKQLDGASLLLFDGTLWQDDEMPLQGAGSKTGQRMGHMSLSGPEGTLAAFAESPVERKVLIHINNTNPILLSDSPERAAVEDAGWQVAYDGMEITL
ncbi:pyrroloquinoline quinone biosynthesis protein PqqB [Denitrobaculum tricleocarpae]|uniref:pyrroloquinoline quinone biosynthesis protein PqqB n=1 Tax=Denitrobaculum tricleocarpae TaxID=2591009 RepID=UPI003CCC4855